METTMAPVCANTTEGEVGTLDSVVSNGTAVSEGTGVLKSDVEENGEGTNGTAGSEIGVGEVKETELREGDESVEEAENVDDDSDASSDSNFDWSQASLVGCTAADAGEEPGWSNVGKNGKVLKEKKSVEGQTTSDGERRAPSNGLVDDETKEELNKLLDHVDKSLNTEMKEQMNQFKIDRVELCKLVMDLWNEPNLGMNFDISPYVKNSDFEDLEGMSFNDLRQTLYTRRDACAKRFVLSYMEKVQEKNTRDEKVKCFVELYKIRNQIIYWWDGLRSCTLDGSKLTVDTDLDLKEAYPVACVWWNSLTSSIVEKLPDCLCKFYVNGPGCIHLDYPSFEVRVNMSSLMHLRKEYVSRILNRQQIVLVLQHFTPANAKIQSYRDDLQEDGVTGLPDGNVFQSYQPSRVENRPAQRLPRKMQEHVSQKKKDQQMVAGNVWEKRAAERKKKEEGNVYKMILSANIVHCVDKSKPVIKVTKEMGDPTTDENHFGFNYEQVDTQERKRVKIPGEDCFSYFCSQVCSGSGYDVSATTGVKPRKVGPYPDKGSILMIIKDEPFKSLVDVAEFIGLENLAADDVRSLVAWNPDTKERVLLKLPRILNRTHDFVENCDYNDELTAEMRRHCGYVPRLAIFQHGRAVNDLPACVNLEYDQGAYLCSQEESSRLMKELEDIDCLVVRCFGPRTQVRRCGQKRYVDMGKKENSCLEVNIEHDGKDAKDDVASKPLNQMPPRKVLHSVKKQRVELNALNKMCQQVSGIDHDALTVLIEKGAALAEESVMAYDSFSHEKCKVRVLELSSILLAVARIHARIELRRKSLEESYGDNKEYFCPEV